MSDTPDFNDKDFQIWLRYNELDFDELSDSEKKEKWEDFYKNHTKEGKLKVSQNQNSDNAKTNIVMHQKQTEPTPEHETWIEKKRNSWQPWCEQEHNPAYIYDENKEFSTGLEFDVYKTQQDKEEGKKAVSVHYDSPRDVTLTTEKGKAPDYEFFAKLAKEAKSDNIPGITFEGEMTPDFKARLAVACLENGLNIENGPENIDVNLLGQDISDDLKKKIETYNKSKELEIAYNNKRQEADKEDKSATFNISDIKDKNEKAIAFAAYTNAGFNVTGLEDGGLVHTPDLHLFPQEAKDTIVKNNESILKDTYKKMKTSAEQYNKSEPVDISAIEDKNEKAIAFAVYKNAGIEVTGLKSQQNPDGLLQTQYLPFMPEEVREVVKNHNYEVRKQQVARLKTRRAELKADPNTSEEVLEAIDEREKVEAAREAVRGMTAEQREAFLSTNEEHRKYLGKNRYENKPDVSLLANLNAKTL